MRRAWMRKMDEVFIDASMAPALGGPKPYITAQANPAFMTVPVDWQKTTQVAGTNQALTLWKLEEALTRMAVNDVDLDSEMVTIAISPQMRQLWLAYAQNAVNDTFAKMIADYRMNPSAGILGCKVVVSNKLAKSTSGQVQALVYSKRAFKTNSPDYEIKIDELPKDRHALQLAAYAKCGVVRRYDELVCGIWVDPNVTTLI